jgi:hypothetical protein
VEKVEKPKITRKELTLQRDELNEEYRNLGMEAREGNVAAQTRRSEIARELRRVSKELHEREPVVTVNVPRSTTGHPFRVGEATFWPGHHAVKKSVAHHLMEMIDKNREAELNRLRANGAEVDLGTIGDKATQVEREL